MAGPALLEISVARHDEQTCGVTLRYERPGELFAPRQDGATVPLDLRALVGHRHDRKAYGEALVNSLTASSKLRDMLRDCLNEALAQPDGLRVRLQTIGDSTVLHSVRWEALADPTDASRWLLTNERVRFSRYVSPTRRQAPRLRDASTLRVLVAIANPPQLSTVAYRDGERHLAPIVIDDEVARMKAALHPLVPEFLIRSEAQPDATTVRGIAAKLREDFDVFCLVCHGALVTTDPQAGPEPVLYVGSDDGRSPVALGGTFIHALSDLPELPRLIVLVSCESAGTGQLPRRDDPSGALAALAPGLARIGVPAVLGMQGSVSMKTMETFLPRFFTELLKDGEIDRAVAAARGAVRDEPDAWMPTLYLQTKDSRAWAAPGAPAPLAGFNQWQKLVEGIADADRTTVAVVGGGLFDSALVPQQQIARRWAKDEGLPFVEHGRDDLPYVAQYVATMTTGPELRERWATTLKEELRQRYAADIPLQATKLSAMIQAIGDAQRARGTTTPHQVLARLPFRIYVVTTPDSLLADALRAEQREPVVETFPWHPSLEGLPTVLDERPRYRPTVAEPLVYHLLGNLSFPASLVLTEDHYLEYLTRVQSREVNTPLLETVEAALKTNPLLLVGFQFDDWDFRVLFRTIGAGRRALRASAGLPPSVAAQLAPDERFLQRGLLQTYVEKYFGGARFDVSWGSPETFLNEVWRWWQSQGARRG
ncbi:MAG: CHAT domain-containing protein [Vicinamibacterales bacterium]